MTVAGAAGPDVPCRVPCQLENPVTMGRMGNVATESFPLLQAQVPTATFVGETPKKTLNTRRSQVRILPPLPRPREDRSPTWAAVLFLYPARARGCGRRCVADPDAPTRVVRQLLPDLLTWTPRHRVVGLPLSTHSPVRAGRAEQAVVSSHPPRPRSWRHVTDCHGDPPNCRPRSGTTARRHHRTRRRRKHLRSRTVRARTQPRRR